MQDHANHKKMMTRLKKISGQINGIIKMVDEQRYCVDILNQMKAIRFALLSIENKILEEHLHHCVQHSMNTNEKETQKEMIDELLMLIKRFN